MTNALGVVSQRTPRGLQYSEFEEALGKYRTAAEQRVARGN